MWFTGATALWLNLTNIQFLSTSFWQHVYEGKYQVVNFTIFCIRSKLLQSKQLIKSNKQISNFRS
jgi:hypothetical protein